ncbi:MerR family DNA-binding transcriptional regulator [Halalkalibacter okhensis]|uniref:HTH merR-type domain-containing protein n=1 Tax=Halalkalibacter okhensis TaxID=333138 RepID=A0A0B0IF95_9BACI|nr:MerR family DNA-binding transcriptional regulator [Halalkalibacter okhensis]KHF41253.1 hypothetical protein LQ50_05710 [Halalkalibacter okhensis]
MRPIDIARKLQISTSTLRSYEARGIVPSPQRSSSGYRLYTDEHLAYFECILAMSPGFGMDITSAVLKKIQLGELDSALWIINKAQVGNYEDKATIQQTIVFLDHLPSKRMMTIGEVATETNVPPSTIRYWEKEGYLTSIREGENNYRLYDMFQLLKVLLMKSMQNEVYSEESVRIKNTMKKLDLHDIQRMKQLISIIQEKVNKRNHMQLQGLAFLDQLCKKLKLYS